MKTLKRQKNKEISRNFKNNRQIDAMNIFFMSYIYNLNTL
ncbi:hypothetical protein CHCC16874_2176 [Bacillus licheniformis]|nr:hypothetical protein CHCC16874_2176 [Bacillus licheniformis]